MASSLEEIFMYYERLFVLQYFAFEGIKHRPTKGEIREDFIKDFFEKRLNTSNISKGILSGFESEWQSSQADFLKLKNNSTHHGLTNDVNDCLIFMEVKSNAKKSELVHLNNISKDMKRRNPSIITGIFCFKTEASEKTILKHFGISYDNEIEVYNDYSLEADIFPNIDFLFSLNIQDEESIMDPTCYFLNRSDKSVDIHKGLNGIAIVNLINKLKYEGV
ncbi:hypothetical protein HCB33_06850 [Listeria sp. FSL L7-0233]|uniref:hypothetical protein n=1 Tax=Listeria TaxID=1637 RepID=UPI000FC2D23D|nr:MULTISPECIES: hypothetical protein [Listeria]EAC4354689.1 hypothetical protein [Listeria monocytogenes]EAD2806919.1 hypothetical protein [Listeria monocytogenes]EAD8168018.1 hypothetical protein [Listeria monocytogenes]EJS8553623.1 hypothetical protein [Listeria monocytogenes]MBC1408686.1 hypothetical protein [Listeria innocua]